MDTKTSSTKNFLFYIKNIDENSVDLIGIFPSIEAALKFRNDFLVKNYDIECDTEEEMLKDFNQTFNGNPSDSFVNNGHEEFNIEPVPVYSK